ncbi:hypothetical protein CBF56_00205 [Lactobacillus taiwanensis]|uniref:hypothetical protein n=1 Tax=Lactobacillus taiwanensis TaxID=508451 RepID=UPI000B987CB5|nr:hypothetical protein [Lactobacillus taiwanensis]OYS20971.1 hypothetical protein CBF56_00205 [Lactobacillus taiwanensis]OYS21069.1 hypothetical protein CBF49_00785 [Lactobacillus taiwanensis]
MDKFIYSKLWFRRRIILRKLSYKDTGPYFAGYIEIKLNDPKDWVRHATASDSEYFYDVWPFTDLPGWPTFAGNLPIDERHLYIGFDTQEFAESYSKEDCIEILKDTAKKLAYDNE